MEGPSGVQDPLLARIAQDLEALPFELIDPVLKELTFLRTLDLFVLPSAGNRLREAIRYHSRWAHLLGEETDDIEYLWPSLNQLALVQYRRPWVKVMAAKIQPYGGVLWHIASPTKWTRKVWRNTLLYSALMSLTHIRIISFTISGWNCIVLSLLF